MSQPNPQAGVGQQVGTTLEGIGGLMVSGHWHHRGHPILYTSSTAALVALEGWYPWSPSFARDSHRILCFRRSLSHTRAAPDEPAQRSPSPAFQRRSPA